MTREEKTYHFPEFAKFGKQCYTCGKPAEYIRCVASHGEFRCEEHKDEVLNYTVET